MYLYNQLDFEYFLRINFHLFPCIEKILVLMYRTLNGMMWYITFDCSWIRYVPWIFHCKSQKFYITKIDKIVVGSIVYQ